MGNVQQGVQRNGLVHFPDGASVFPSLHSSRAHGQLGAVSQPGVCHYGSRLDCCPGWRKNKGHCEGNVKFLLVSTLWLHTWY